MDLGVEAKMPILKKNRLSTGIADLDLVLEGGFRNPGNLLLVGPSGMEKAAFAYHFASAGKDVKSFSVCGKSSPTEWA